MMAEKKISIRIVQGLLTLVVSGCLVSMAGAQSSSPWSKFAQLISPQGKPQQTVNQVQAQRKEAGVDEHHEQQPFGDDKGFTGLAVATSGRGDQGRIDLGQESEDSESQFATKLMKDPEVRRMLGDEPRFLYQAGNRPDPMLVPWVRRQVIYRELDAQADLALEEGDVDRAVALYERIIAMDDPRFTAMATQKLSEISASLQSDQAMQVLEQTEELVELPPWVYDNTTGVVVSDESNMCLVGDYLLHVGEVLPNYPDITVEAVSSDSVIYSYKDRDFEVILKKD